MKQLPKWAFAFACVEGQKTIFPLEVLCYYMWTGYFLLSRLGDIIGILYLCDFFPKLKILMNTLKSKQAFAH